MTIKYKEFNKHFIEDRHGKLYFYRDMYEGNHAKIFPRAQKLIDDGELIDNILNKQMDVPFVQTPYIVANVAKLIIEIPAILVARSIGKITTSQPKDPAQNTAVNTETFNEIEGPNQNNSNGLIENTQAELIEQIVKNSELDESHWSNIVQQQLDGGLVGVPVNSERGLRVEFKGREFYYPHEDKMGADICENIKDGDQHYLYVYRERLMLAGERPEKLDENEVPLDDFLAPANGLRCVHRLIPLTEAGAVEDVPLGEKETAEILNVAVEDLAKFYEGRKRMFIRYMVNEKTLMNPLGVSAIRNQDGKQDEINWTLTRNGAVFERNGKPRLAVNRELAAALQKEMVKLYGETARGKFDTRKLEVVSMDAQGKSIEVIQIDVTKIGDVQWVKDLLKLMLMETKTSEKAIDFYMSSDSSSAQSGIAKFYDLFVSLMKAEMIREDYVRFLKDLIKDALWLAALDDPNVNIEEPEIGYAEMLPIQRKEVTDENTTAYKEGVQSLETTIRRNNPQASEQWWEEEEARIEAEKATAASFAQQSGAATVQSFLANPNLPENEEE